MKRAFARTWGPSRGPAASLYYQDEEEILAGSPDPERTYREKILPHKLDFYEEYVNNMDFIGRAVADSVREHRPQIVFHVAAHKHVPLMECSIPEAIMNNVLGTAADDHERVERGLLRMGIGFHREGFE